MHKLVLSPKFQKELSKSIKNNSKIEKQVVKVFKLILQNFNHPSLRTHKLKGNEELYSISVNMSIRIILSIKGERIFLLRIGTHEEVY